VLGNLGGHPEPAAMLGQRREVSPGVVHLANAFPEPGSISIFEHCRWCQAGVGR
jgi:hypothetical protein